MNSEHTNFCSNCGAVEDNLVEIERDGETLLVCVDCAERLGFVQCENCGEWIPADESYDSVDGAICEDCYLNDYATCEDCGDIIPLYDAFEVNRVRYRGNETFLVCGHCAEDYPVCDDCGKRVTEDSIAYSDYSTCICRDCSDNWVVCYDCGSVIHLDDAYYDDDSGEYYCEEHRPDHGDIHEYSFKPIPIIYHEADETDDALRLGVELEVDYGYDRNALASDLRDNEHLYLKKDGSLDSGVEIVTHPCTLAYHTHSLGWAGITYACKFHGFKSHDAETCGLHVHIGRYELGNTDVERLGAAGKIVIVANRIYDDLRKFARRSTEKANQWAARSDAFDDLPDGIDDDGLIIRALDTRKRGRYQVVNLENEPTVEVRIFRGTLKTETLLASLQLTHNLARFAMTHTATECLNATFADVRDVAHYAELQTYCERLGLA